MKFATSGCKDIRMRKKRLWGVLLHLSFLRIQEIYCRNDFNDNVDSFFFKTEFTTLKTDLT